MKVNNQLRLKVKAHRMPTNFNDGKWVYYGVALAVTSLVAGLFMLVEGL